mgnify:CR=1 FL=1
MLKNLFRTDLAYDEVEYLNLVENIKSDSGINISKLNVDKDLSNKINKKVGIYYTIDLVDDSFHDYKKSELIEEEVANILRELLALENVLGKKCLVVGLGNINVTPDALGPYTLDNVIVTRHLFNLGEVSDKYSEVSGISPGVMGSTGIETFDIIKSIIKDINVDYLIIVDALCSSSIKRINKTIQITNTGISPGSGVGNKRKEISKETLGLPVIAVGIPTVVDFVTIASEIMDLVVKYLDFHGKSEKINFLNPKDMNLDSRIVDENLKTKFLGEIGKLNDNQKKELLYDVVNNGGYNMIVTPKEIDLDIEDLSKIVAMSINKAVHDF